MLEDLLYFIKEEWAAQWKGYKDALHLEKVRRFRLVLRHAIVMYRTLSLPKNEQKGTWRDMPTRYLLELAQKEYEELFTACWDLECGRGSARRVEEEASDLSAFAAMIADVARADAKYRAGEQRMESEL